MVFGNNQSVVCVSSCFYTAFLRYLMIWQTTWERHHVAGNQSSLSEQLGEGEIELRNELPGGESMPHGICAMQDVTFSSNVMKGTASRFYRRSRPTGVTVA